MTAALFHPRIVQSDAINDKDPIHPLASTTIAVPLPTTTTYYSVLFSGRE
jgi:hypothetical protein